MPQSKNVFIKSKMNKDLDDRLLPQGQYRDALNIQVSKSESEDVGALENVLGNKSVVNFETVTGEDDVIVVGYHVSEVRSTIYFFLTNNVKSGNSQGVYISDAKNFIIATQITANSAITNTILVQGPFLNFWEGAPITSVNLLENLLYFTDNRNQPRKINVDFAADSPNYYQIEDTISVAKYFPYTSPVLWQEVTQQVINDSGTPADLQPALGAYQTTMQDVVSEFLPDGTTNNPYQNPVYQGDPDYLEDKFVRFSYRFKFDDGEYSVFAPFTQECFIPQQDGYFLFTDVEDNDMSNSYRSTVVDFMENKVNQITLLITMPECADPNAYSGSTTTLENVIDHFKITELEILYKESNSNAALVVDTITANQITAQYDAANPSNIFSYKYSGTKPFKTLPEADLIRVFDKVPVKALGQEVISNRIVYSNFQTRHTPPTIDYNVGAGEKQNFDVTTPVTPVSWNVTFVEYPNSTLKQNRNYQAGFVLSDRFGRTTSVILSNDADVSASASASQLSTVYSPYLESSAQGGPQIDTWPGNALFVQVNSEISETPVPLTLYPGTFNGNSDDSSYNPLGFYSWKVVVKQQEQDYYNVYLPGVLAAYPLDPTQEIGLTSHMALINDNINKLPRDLTEVGPEQKQFRSSVQLFGRVENTEITGALNNFGVVNRQYFPERFSDTVSTISTMFDLFNITDLVNIDPKFEVFYEDESNPLIARISTKNKFGAIEPSGWPVAAQPVDLQQLAVYETEPVESRLDIYWETSTSGTIAQLNEQVQATGGQTIFSLENLQWNFTEGYGIYTGNPAAPEPGPGSGGGDADRAVIAGPLWFEDPTTTEIQNVNLLSYSFIDNAGVSRASNVNPTDFEILKIQGTLNGGPGTYTDYLGNQVVYQPTGQPFAWDTFIIVNKTYKLYETASVNATEFNITITVEDAGLVVPVPKTFTLTPNSNGTVMANKDTIIVGGETFGNNPTTWGDITSPFVYTKTCPPNQVVIDYGVLGNNLQFYGNNGANRNGQAASYFNQQGLQWSITSETKNGVASTDFQIDANTGIITQTGAGSASGFYIMRIQCAGPDGTTDLCDLNLIVGESPTDGSFSDGNLGGAGLILVPDGAFVISLHNNSNNFASDKGIVQYPNDINNSTGWNQLYQSQNCNSTNSGGTGPTFAEAIQLQGTNGGYGLQNGTGYIQMNLNAAAPYYFGSNVASYLKADLQWNIEYRDPNGPGYPNNWEPAVDIEGNVLTSNSNFGTSVINPIQSNNTQIMSNHLGSSVRNMVYGADDNYAGGAGVNKIAALVQSRSSNFSNFGEVDFSKWAVVDTPGEYRIVTSNFGGNCADCIGCGGIQNAQNYQPSFFLNLSVGDFYYGFGNQRAFVYQYNPAGQSTRSGAENLTSFTQTVYAREPLLRYVSRFYTDPQLTNPASVIIGVGNYVAYKAGTAAGAGFSLPGNAQGNQINATSTLSRVAENSSISGGNATTTQDRRVWVAQFTGAGVKLAGTSEPRTA